ncbi:hypothetical protein [Tellurirhabdus bombi]|uniref:hypothetical protein n=1 Tax=Tellurirhabdus bombi TaxID=2907205 RepID=UPI001F247382|nr:hypothetical protein [Tellurirhabdus bombi]
MIKAFQEALEQGFIQKASLPDGRPFIIGGVQYYEATGSGTNLMMGRFHAFTDTLRKHDTLKLNSELFRVTLQGFKSLIRTALSQYSIDPERAQENIQQCQYTLTRLRERRLLGIDVSMIYEAAAIWFFGEDEDPATVSSDINQKKIDEWLLHPELYAFFLNTPFGRFLPSSGLVDPGTLTYIQSVNREEIFRLSIQLLKSPQSGLTNATTSAIESLRETLLRCDSLIDSRLSSTTTTPPPGSGMSDEK